MSELLDDAALETARRQGEASPFRRLALSEDPGAAALRAGLQQCFELAGNGRDTLRRSLLHERWGQHVGALAQLLALGMLARQGFRVTSEPALGGQAPDVLAERDRAPRASLADGQAAPEGAATDAGAPGALRVLVEVRAITGAGRFPWLTRRAPGRATPAEREAEARAAATRAQTLRDTVAQVLARKARAYAALVTRLELPFAICLYEDLDDQIADVAAEVVFGRDGTPRGGAFLGPLDGPDGGLRDVSAVIVFGRADTPDGALLLRGSVLHNPAARRPLPSDAFPLLQRRSASTPRHNALRAQPLRRDNEPPLPFSLG